MNVKMLKWVLPMLALPTLVISCSQDDDPNYHGGEYVSINSVGIGELQTRSGYEATDNFLPTRGDIRLFLKSSNADSQYSADYFGFTCDGASWKSDVNLPWAEGSTATWSAFFTSAANDGYDAEKDSIFVTLPNDQSALTDNEFNDLDLLVAKGSASTSKLNMQFKHILSKVRVNVYNETGYLDGKTINNLRITNNRYRSTMLNTASIGIPTSDDEWSIVTPQEDFQETEFVLKQVETQSDCFATYEAIVPPFTTRYLVISAKIEETGNRIGYSFEPSLFNLSAESGQILEFNIYAGGDELITVESTIKGWTNAISDVKLETE